MRIKDFAKSPRHGSLTAIAIMSHGNELGAIRGDDGVSTCSVQQIIDALCQPELESVVKVQIVVKL